ncbi:MAG: hypothetical protein ACK4KW_08455 [Gemmobacter sp.]
MRLSPAILALLLLSACGTPQEQCIAAVTRDLTVLDRLIAETGRNLSRGYAVETFEVSDFRYVPCRIGTDAAGNPVWSRCLEDFSRTATRPVAIDLDAERRKLASMQRKRAELARAAGPAIAECRARYPE